MTPPAGRRPGNRDTRAQILRSAKRTFARRGYDGASVRAIAADAGVDPAMISHYFGGKEQLFLESIAVPADPRIVADRVLEGPIGQAGERLVHIVLNLWDSEAGLGAVSLLRSAVQREDSARMMREFLIDRVLRPVMLRLSTDPHEAAWRASLTASQIGGLLLARYVLRLEPLASAPVDALSATVGPTLQRYLTGDIPAAPPH